MFGKTFVELCESNGYENLYYAYKKNIMLLILQSFYYRQ